MTTRNRSGEPDVAAAALDKQHDGGRVFPAPAVDPVGPLVTFQP